MHPYLCPCTAVMAARHSPRNALGRAGNPEGHAARDSSGRDAATGQNDSPGRLLQAERSEPERDSSRRGQRPVSPNPIDWIYLVPGLKGSVMDTRTKSQREAMAMDSIFNTPQIAPFSENSESDIYLSELRDAYATDLDIAIAMRLRTISQF